jgi:DNA-binding PadR family transcriptional regulator
LPRVNRTRYAILGMLSFEPMSGYEIKKRFDNSIAHFWQENYSRIYPVLGELEEAGLVTKRTEHTEGKPSRNVFSITDEGMKDLRDWLLLPAERPTLRIELLLKLFFGHAVPVENMIVKVKEEKRSCEQILQVFAQIENHMDNISSSRNTCDENITFGLITLRYGQRYYEAVSRWCDETLDVLNECSSSSETITIEEE